MIKQTMKMQSDKEITEKELVQHIANTLYCGKCWRASLVAVSEPKYLVRLLKFYKGEYSNNTEAAKRIQRSIEKELQKWEQKIRQEAEEEGYLKALCKSLNIVSETLRETGLADRVRKFMLATKRKMEEELKKEGESGSSEGGRGLNAKGRNKSGSSVGTAAANSYECSCHDDIGCSVTNPSLSEYCNCKCHNRKPLGDTKQAKRSLGAKRTRKERAKK